MELQESARKQTQVSAKLTSQIFSKQFPLTNVFYSPLSIHYMLNNIAKKTAKGKTLKELLGFLKTKNKNDNNSFYNHFNNILARNAPSAGCFSISDNTLFMTIGGGYSPRPRFMNDHYCRGGWFELFAGCSVVKKCEFYLLGGDKVKVPFMTVSKEYYVCGEYDGFKVVGFPHFDSHDKTSCKFVVYVFLPDAKDGLKSLVEKVCSTPDDGFFESYLPEKKVELGEFSLPMFQVFSEFDVTSSLKELGLLLPFSVESTPEMFDPVERQNVCVVGVHQNFGFSLFRDTRGGGEVAAASVGRVGSGGSSKKKSEAAKVVGEGSCSQEPAIKVVGFVADHPFMFMMRDEVTKTVFFVGQVIDPSVKVKQMWYPKMPM